jgi:hypothetical protein
VGATTRRTHGFKDTMMRATISSPFIHTCTIHFKKQLPLPVNPSQLNKIKHLECIDVQLIAKLKAVAGATECNMTRIEVALNLVQSEVADLVYGKKFGAGNPNPQRCQTV